MPLRDRINNHLSCIRSRKATPIGLHFNSKGHSILDFTILPIERIHNSSKVATQQRRLKESTWQNLLQTAYPYGMNNLNKNLQQSVDWSTLTKPIDCLTTVRPVVQLYAARQSPVAVATTVAPSGESE
jgi:hypothetical protein